MAKAGNGPDVDDGNGFAGDLIVGLGPTELGWLNGRRTEFGMSVARMKSVN